MGVAKQAAEYVGDVPPSKAWMVNAYCWPATMPCVYVKPAGEGQPSVSVGSPLLAAGTMAKLVTVPVVPPSTTVRQASGPSEALGITWTAALAAAAQVPPSPQVSAPHGVMGTSAKLRLMGTHTPGPVSVSCWQAVLSGQQSPSAVHSGVPRPQAWESVSVHRGVTAGRRA